MGPLVRRGAPPLSRQHIQSVLWGTLFLCAEIGFCLAVSAVLESDIKLLDTYKRLDAVCRDMFSSERGVGEYIDAMERIPSYKRTNVPLWDTDYRMLKRLRWLRNQIVHEICPPDCSADDVDWLEDFYRRVLKQQDPIAVLTKVTQSQSMRIHTVQQPKVDAQMQSNLQKEEFTTNKKQKPQKDQSPWEIVRIVATIAAIIVALLIIHYILK